MGEFYALSIEEQEKSERTGGVFAEAIFVVSVVGLLFFAFGKQAASSSSVDLLHSSSGLGLGGSSLVRLGLDLLGGLDQRGSARRSAGPNSGLRRLL